MRNVVKWASVSAAVVALSACTVEGDVTIETDVGAAHVDTDVQVNTCDKQDAQTMGDVLKSCGKSGWFGPKGEWSATEAIATVETEKVIVRGDSGTATVYVYSGAQLLGARTFATNYQGSSLYNGMEIFFASPGTVENWIDNLDAGGSDSYKINIEINNLSYERVSYNGGTASSTVSGYFNGHFIGSATDTWTIPDRPIE